MYDYRVYGYMLHSEIELPLPAGTKDETTEIVTLTVNQGSIFTDEICLRFQNEYIEISTSFVRYTIYPAKNQIHAEFRAGVEDVICTLLNIPFSLFCLVKGDILLHCGCVENGGELYALAADKGVGKTTLVTNMAKSINLFSDDTLRVTDKLVCYGVNNFAKLSKTSYEMLFGNSYDEVRYERPDGKIFITASDFGLKVASTERGILKSIFLLERNRFDHVEINPVTTERSKEILLLSNVVGISYLDKHITNHIFSMPLFHQIVDNVPFFKMQMINDIRRISENAFTLEAYIRQ